MERGTWKMHHGTDMENASWNMGIYKRNMYMSRSQRYMPEPAPEPIYINEPEPALS
jgi:hypothetical protein